MLHACIAAALMAAPGDAPAYAVGVLAVAPPPGPGAELVEMTVQLRQALSRLRAGVLDGPQLRQRMSGRAPGASLAELDRAFEAARAAYLRGDHDGSARTLRIILEELDKLPPGGEAFRQWTRAMLRLARSELDLGRADAARSILDRLVRAWPDVEVDRALHPPRLVQLVESARAALRAEPTQVLAVTAPPGARVYLNGRDLGVAPLGVSLARGRYALSASLGPLLLPPMPVSLLDEEQRLTLDFSVPEALRPDLGPGLALPEEDRHRRLAAAGGHLGLDELVVVRLADEGGARYLVGSLLDVRRGTFGLQGRVRLATPRPPSAWIDELAEYLVTGSVNTLRLGAPPGARPAPAVEALDPAGRPPALAQPPPPAERPAPTSPPPPSSGFQLALSVSWDSPIGDAAGNASMASWLRPQGTLGLEGTWHLTTSASAGFHLRLGGGAPGPAFQALCQARGSSCDSFVAGLAPLFRWTFDPGAPWSPWVAARIGVETNGGANEKVDFYLEGWEAALQGGIDRSIGDGSQLGLLGTVALGSYGTFHSSPAVDMGLRGRALHAWLGLGVRLVVGR